MSQIGTPDPEQDRGELADVETVTEALVRERLAGVLILLGRATKTNPRAMHIPAHTVLPDAPADQCLCGNPNGGSYRRAAPSTYPGEHAELCERCKQHFEALQQSGDASDEDQGTDPTPNAIPTRTSTTVHATGGALIPRALHRSVGIPAWLWIGADDRLHVSPSPPDTHTRLERGEPMTHPQQAYRRTAERNEVPQRMIRLLGGTPGDTIEWWDNAVEVIGVIR